MSAPEFSTGFFFGPTLEKPTESSYQGLPVRGDLGPKWNGAYPLFKNPIDSLFNSYRPRYLDEDHLFSIMNRSHRSNRLNHHIKRFIRAIHVGRIRLPSQAVNFVNPAGVSRCVLSRRFTVHAQMVLPKPILNFVPVACMCTSRASLWMNTEDVQGFGAFGPLVLDQGRPKRERLFGEVMCNWTVGSPYGSDIAKAKAIWFMARYLCNQVPKPSDRIASLIEQARAAVESARLHAAPPAMLAVVETQLESLRYQATGSLTHALGTARMIDRTYRDHSEDVAAIVLKAEKLLYAPAIGEAI